MPDISVQSQVRPLGPDLLRRGGLNGLIRRVIRELGKFMRGTGKRAFSAGRFSKAASNEERMTIWEFLGAIGFGAMTALFVGYIFQMSVDRQIIGCSTARPATSTIYSKNKGDGHFAKEGTLQIIVLTHDRLESFDRLMTSLKRAHYDKEPVDLRVWIDRSSTWDGGIFDKIEGVIRVLKGERWDTVDKKILTVADGFDWPYGRMSVHVWDWHVGIWGQWIDSWRPISARGFGLILEDDIEVSPHYYQFLKRAREKYGQRNDVFGYTLQRGTLRANQTGFGRRGLQVDEKELIYLYPLVGSWGYAPEGRVWKEFRKWFHKKSCEKGFHPYVEGLTPTKWYKKQEKKRSMWTMWHIKYAEEMGLLTVYANLPDKKTLASNWREPGLHFRKQDKKNVKKASRVTKEKDFELLNWSKEYGQKEWRYELPDDPIVLSWSGTYVNRQGHRTIM